jgi:hypothetical protein
MKSPNKDKLALLLPLWKVTPKSNPGFRAAVWAKIEATSQEPLTWGGWLRMNVGTVAPLAVAVVTFSIVGGGIAAKTKASDQREVLIERYLSSIDPHRQIGASESQ